MIAVDSSALVAILLEEPENEIFLDRIAREHCLVSAVNAHETATVLRMRHSEAAVLSLWSLLAEKNIEIVVFDEAQMRAAVDAFYRFGKGIHSKARLNLCDCAAYALAKTMQAPLLFKGDDFSHTDIASAL